MYSFINDEYNMEYNANNCFRIMALISFVISFIYYIVMALSNMFVFNIMPMLDSMFAFDNMLVSIQHLSLSRRHTMRSASACHDDAHQLVRIRHVGDDTRVTMPRR